MKTTNAKLSIIAMVIMGILSFSCTKEADNNTDEQEVNFTIGISKTKSTNALKSTLEYNLNDVKKLVLTIQFSDGSPTKYSTSDINVQQIDGVFYSQKITLKTGSYKLVEFDLVDVNGNTIFAAPLNGSLQAQNTTTPLPVNFSVVKNVTSLVNVEVLSTEFRTPDDFGLNRFPIIDIRTFTFLMGVVDSKTETPIDANVTVSGTNYSFTQNISNILNNTITVKDGLSRYYVSIVKSGYKSVSKSFSLDSLKLFENKAGNLPIIIDLSKIELPTEGLVAYYPLIGNANDASGNGNNGAVLGPIATNDRFGNANSAYNFNGISDYISVSHSSSFNFGTGDFTLHATVLLTTIPSTLSYAIITKHNTANWHDTEFFLYINPISGTANFGLSTNSGVFERIDGITNVCDGQFHAICGVKRNGKIYLYVDGIIEGYADSAINPDNSNPINIGRSSYNNGNAFHFFGVIDDVSIYNRALSDQEISDIYNYRSSI